MAQQHHRSRALLGEMNANPIGLDRSMCYLVHGVSVSGLSRMVLHRREFCLDFCAEKSLRLRRLQAFAALPHGDRGLSLLERVTQRPCLGQRVSIERLA